jgi:lipopolysaccharide export system protein LptA
MKFHKGALLAAAAFLLAAPASLSALETDRQQPLEVNADATDGSLGDGIATLKGNVEIRQGTLLIQSDIAEVEKVDGRVRKFELNGNPVHLQQEIEEEGLVMAEAKKVEYMVATGIVTLTGAADVIHPQYHISGEILEYDMNTQHFQGSGGDNNGRIRIRLDPEVVPGNLPEDDGSGEDEPGAPEETGETG